VRPDGAPPRRPPGKPWAKRLEHCLSVAGLRRRKAREVGLAHLLPLARCPYRERGHDLSCVLIRARRIDLPIRASKAPLPQFGHALSELAIRSSSSPEELECRVVRGTVLAARHVDRPSCCLDVRFSAQAQQHHSPQKQTGLRGIHGKAGVPEQPAKQNGVGGQKRITS
jgi:hypothetical protein